MLKTRAQVLERNGYTCQMCGVAAGDPDPLGSNRTVRLTMGHIIDKSKGGDDTPQNLRAVCTNCNEGLQNTALPKPDQLHLLIQIRRATIQDQQAVLDWLLQKFNLEAQKKDKNRRRQTEIIYFALAALWKFPYLSSSFKVRILPEFVRSGDCLSCIRQDRVR